MTTSESEEIKYNRLYKEYLKSDNIITYAILLKIFKSEDPNSVVDGFFEEKNKRGNIIKTIKKSFSYQVSNLPYLDAQKVYKKINEELILATVANEKYFEKLLEQDPVVTKEQVYKFCNKVSFALNAFMIIFYTALFIFIMKNCS